MTHSFWWLYWIIAFLAVIALLSILAAVQSWREWNKGCGPVEPPAKFPPGYGYPSLQDWQRNTMAKFRAPWWKRLRRWFGTLALLLLLAQSADGRDLDGRYAASPLKPWFDSLRSGKGPCCSDADGSAVSDVDWQSAGGHYRVRLDGVWLDVPDDAVLTVPNLVGRTMVWPMWSDGVVSIRCFMPGSMT